MWEHIRKNTDKVWRTEMTATAVPALPLGATCLSGASRDRALQGGLIGNSIALAIGVEMLIDHPRLGSAYGCGKCLYISALDSFYSLQLRQQRLLRLRAYAADVVELAVQGVLGPLVAVKGNGVAVNLVLDACKGVEEFAFDIEADCADGVTIE